MLQFSVHSDLGTALPGQPRGGLGADKPTQDGDASDESNVKVSETVLIGT